ncbi:uncharacterized protein LOC123551985 [Mercenaria mercenaria]|uniref:uncharacterized protein LOC123551985 n=1 Tax=Mercenaria mercenaria TaxID=6596 RepID=UPI00234E8BAF|nr:uncharacterized protein LOC123551985 [Mercenaria mercenaria]
MTSGLQKRVRHMSPLSLYLNCRNHRLALCFTHLLKKNETMADVEALLVSIWKVFHFSAKRHAVFRQMQELYDETPLTFIRAAATRWLSHLRACVSFISRYESLLYTLDTIFTETREPEIAGIRAKAADRKTVLTILLLSDVLKPVNHLSLYLQSDIGYFSSLTERVKACINELHGLIEQYEQGQFDDDLEFRKCDDLLNVISDRTDLARRLRDDNNQLTPHDYLQTVGIPMIPTHYRD